jgi:hypothetical protein
MSYHLSNYLHILKNNQNIVPQKSTINNNTIVIPFTNIPSNSIIYKKQETVPKYRIPLLSDVEIGKLISHDKQNVTNEDDNIFKKCIRKNIATPSRHISAVFKQYDNY